MSHSPNTKMPSWPALETPELLAVVSSRPSDTSVVAEMLKGAGLKLQGDNARAHHGPKSTQPVLIITAEPGRIEGWADWLAENPRGHLLLLVNLPSVAIARRLAEGTVPEAALAQWQDRAQTALGVIRAHRRRISLVFSEPIRTEPQTFLRALAQRLNIQLQWAEMNSTPSELPAALLRMMAENAILQSAEARLLATELEANALPLPDAQASCLPAVDAVFAEYRNSIDAEARAASELREENQLLLEKLQRVQQKMEAFSAEKRLAEQRAADAVQQGITNADQQRTDLQEENELLLQQLHHVQEELEHYYLQNMQTNKQQLEELQQLQQRLQAAEETVAALYNSKSWKITKPLRIMLDLFTGGNKTG